MQATAALEWLKRPLFTAAGGSSFGGGNVLIIMIAASIEGT